jgi:hypothetical protein
VKQFEQRAPKLKFYSEGFCPFLGPTKPNNHNFYGPKLKFYSGAFVLLGRLPNSNFTPGFLPILGAHWGILGFKGVKNFGELYQKINTILKIQITLFAFKIIAIHDNTLLAPANGQKPPKSNLSLGPQR